jgi:hypothetical protein
MLIYNTTFHVEGENNLSPFLTYMRDVYVPAAIRDGLLQNPRFVRLLTEVGDNLFGYALMCEVEDVKILKKWKLETGRTLESNFHQQFGEKVLMFSTSMKDVTEKVVGSE